MIDQTKITFQSDGSPYSSQFEDIYFDTNHGTSQSECVFIDGNNIKARLAKYPEKFVIAETGFGTGLNFLLTLAAFDQLQRSQNLQNTKPAVVSALHFISVEKYPLSKAQLTQSLKILPDIDQYSQQLIAQYPEHPEQDITLSFLNGAVTLQLIFNDATLGLAQLASDRNSRVSAIVDAWYLDGFSPAKNPEMWQEGLFQQITRLSKEQATLSTFTVSGKVKRQLISAGFRVEKRPTKGKKDEMLIAAFQQNPNSGKAYQQRPIITKPQQVSIIGGGIASACAAYALTKVGVKVTVYCQDFSVAQGASSNNIAALYPLIHQQADDISLFYQHAFEQAVSYYKSINEQGFHFDHDWCGLLEISYKPALALRQQHIANSDVWPKNLIQSVDKATASELAGIALNHGGLFFPKAGWIAPAQLVKQIFKAAELTNRLRIETGCKIDSVSQKSDGKWLLHSDKENYQANVLIYCGGAQGIPLNLIEQLPLTSVRGQVSNMVSNEQVAKLSTVICHKGYLTPANKNLHCIGATFQKHSFDIESKTEEDQFNLAMLDKCLPGLTQWQTTDIASSKARLRCMTPDHLPMVGAMPDIEAHKQEYPHLSKDKRWRYNEPAPVIENLYMLTGLGARGLCTAPLLADILTADICGTPYPLNNEQLFNLAPNRFVIRDIIRRKFD
ncbi:bifunctional tRNA (5-methylaminomethyl-2-thiouridine)(34)-methyltransferase MnmD/FAD-dependent 5-carboxymethylaminomethyl-2-thiouridine(34) oxidoreductase MnmC [Colwellia sp. BRX10-3]|uniref:bifunctional tRNA (5-methylaminomethyl-2-thiouridine)(34)-methyltransferase MnmD/FAD-dependent 5-carboxymethylaminomethyl-2-thiouridine(34) oxidoreductase MnmC n=1 Tax=Colwellia sp. BRX10-3 TaxID=2759844 RepID=UPI002873EAE9|nr:bifunctional tRNA (5-methylaminomethyl-2-thiouridine)(34)-methyltransferase MnmD/FAD-dependent 5-carboxymethylaminomethyl-2-thiouridine(34) oxidoreductase MnmC [Colwellia sp. BRX10-3]